MGNHVKRQRDESPSPETKLLQRHDIMESSEKVKYPKSVFFIMGNEFCERFSYYGMRTVLTLYLTTVLLFSDDTATVIYHVFTVLCYFTPLFGAILSDTLLGKFKTIFYISIVYAIGNVILAISSIPDLHLPILVFSMLGLLLIGVGTGGIKPCVAAFGGDQFESSQEKQRQQFFSIFYFCINAGSLLSTFITPMLRSQVTCFGMETCYPLAFGIPAILMVVSLILFICGRPLYKIVPPQGNIIINVVKVISCALSRRFTSGHQKRSHWLDHADDKFDKNLIEDVKAVLRVLFMFIPLPFFWALFDQQGSRWTLQATRMNGNLPFLNFTLQPDQIQVVNPLLIIGMIPVFEIVIYPLLRKCNLLVRPLQRISFGGILAAISFVVAAFLQIELEKTFPTIPNPFTSELTLVNSMPCPLTVNITGQQFEVEPLANYTLLTSVSSITNITGTAVFSSSDKSCPLDKNISSKVEFYPRSETAFLMAFGVVNEELVYSQGEESRKKAEKGKSDVKIVYNVVTSGENATILLKSVKPKGKEYCISLVDDFSFGITNYTLIEPDEYTVYLPLENNCTDHSFPSGKFTTGQGAAYTLIIYAPTRESIGSVVSINTVEPNTLSMLLQVPQYLIITFGEIMFSITGLEFSYSQAPESMKSVLQAAWLLTVAFGNLIVVIVAEAQIFELQSNEFFLFAGLMGLDMIVFMIMSYFYVYVDPEEQRRRSLEASPTQEKGNMNYGFEDDTKM